MKHDELLQTSIKLRATTLGRQPSEIEIQELKKAIRILHQYGGKSAVDIAIRDIKKDLQKGERDE